MALWSTGIWLIREHPRTLLAALGLIMIITAWCFTGVGVKRYGLSLVSRSDVNLPPSVILMLLPWAVLPEVFLMLISPQGQWYRVPVDLYIYAETHGWFVGLMVLISVAAYQWFKKKLRDAIDKLEYAVLIQPVVVVAFVAMPQSDWPPPPPPAEWIYYFSGVRLAVYLGFALACNMSANADS